MARPRRILYHGALYHVMSRGNRKGKLFLDDIDRLGFLEFLGSAHQQHHVKWRSHVLMTTHYHLIAETPLANLARVMEHVNGQFAKWWNRRHRKTGHVFDGPYRAIPIEDGRYAISALRYVAKNPVEAGYVDRPGDWTWSSYRATAGLEEAPAFLDLGWLQGFFGGRTLSEAQREFKGCIDSPSAAGDYDENPDQIVVGSHGFQEDVRRQIGSTMHGLLVPRSYRALARPPLSQLFTGKSTDLEQRDQMIRRAQVVYGYRQSEIARALNLHPNTVSKIVSRLKRQKFFLIKLAD